jgi:hypothetical protein
MQAASKFGALANFKTSNTASDERCVFRLQSVAADDVYIAQRSACSPFKLLTGRLGDS